MEAPYVADTDAAFLALRSDVRQDIRVAEVEMQRTIIAMLGSLIPVVGPEIVTSLQSIISEPPAGFIRSMLPFLQSLSEMRDQAEAIAPLIRKA